MPYQRDWWRDNAEGWDTRGVVPGTYWMRDGEHGHYDPNPPRSAVGANIPIHSIDPDKNIPRQYLAELTMPDDKLAMALLVFRAMATVTRNGTDYTLHGHEAMALVMEIEKLRRELWEG